MRRLLLAAALLGSVAQATVAPKLSLTEQARKAQVIVQARVAAVTAQERDGQRWTVYRLNLVETLAGNAASLPVIDNTPAMWVLEGVENAPTLRVNDEAVLLLYTGLMDSPVVGFNQGIYRIANARVEGGDPAELAAFKAALLRARGSQ
ncbi:hypothetical protein [Deinococcus peraridilitoris]|uniref:Uncharacterized protein n=1 Tax=Deinococcus peraridilitoris (strain DSM 19664 / LMG 22246 / CIP 109416 / KR-200) TaxID=937777 RepID=L0A533_DEIPD|nr:hypothetical protein [Deinococcus peraridilitoris]AFZ68998.1 hypothetical protein Deipe_3568 [Deinococcus peraridilitoris DSM 19664]